MYSTSQDVSSSQIISFAQYTTEYKYFYRLPKSLNVNPEFKMKSTTVLLKLDL